MTTAPNYNPKEAFCQLRKCARAPYKTAGKLFFAARKGYFSADYVAERKTPRNERHMPSPVAQKYRRKGARPRAALLPRDLDAASALNRPVGVLKVGYRSAYKDSERRVEEFYFGVPPAADRLEVGKGARAPARRQVAVSAARGSRRCAGRRGVCSDILHCKVSSENNFCPKKALFLLYSGPLENFIETGR